MSLAYFILCAFILWMHTLLQPRHEVFWLALAFAVGIVACARAVKEYKQ